MVIAFASPQQPLLSYLHPPTRFPNPYLKKIPHERIQINSGVRLKTLLDHGIQCIFRPHKLYCFCRGAIVVAQGHQHLHCLIRGRSSPGTLLKDHASFGSTGPGCVLGCTKLSKKSSMHDNAKKNRSVPQAEKVSGFHSSNLDVIYLFSNLAHGGDA